MLYTHAVIATIILLFSYPILSTKKFQAHAPDFISLASRTFPSLLHVICPPPHALSSSLFFCSRRGATCLEALSHPLQLGTSVALPVYNSGFLPVPTPGGASFNAITFNIRN